MPGASGTLTSRSLGTRAIGLPMISPAFAGPGLSLAALLRRGRLRPRRASPFARGPASPRQAPPSQAQSFRSRPCYGEASSAFAGPVLSLAALLRRGRPGLGPRAIVLSGLGLPGLWLI